MLFTFQLDVSVIASTGYIVIHRSKDPIQIKGTKISLIVRMMVIMVCRLIIDRWNKLQEGQETTSLIKHMIISMPAHSFHAGNVPSKDSRFVDVKSGLARR
jgi:hypothetical protein